MRERDHNLRGPKTHNTTNRTIKPSTFHERLITSSSSLDLFEKIELIFLLLNVYVKYLCGNLRLCYWFRTLGHDRRGLNMYTGTWIVFCTSIHVIPQGHSSLHARTTKTHDASAEAQHISISSWTDCVAQHKTQIGAKTEHTRFPRDRDPSGRGRGGWWGVRFRGSFLR